MDALQAVKLRVLSNELCNRTFPIGKTILPSHLCLSHADAKKDACQVLACYKLQRMHLVNVLCCVYV